MVRKPKHIRISREWRELQELREKEKIQRGLQAAKRAKEIEKEYYKKKGMKELVKFPKAMRNARNLKKALEREVEHLLEEARRKEKELGRGASFVNAFFEPQGSIEEQIGRLKELNKVLDKALEEEKAAREEVIMLRKNVKSLMPKLSELNEESRKYYGIMPELKEKIEQLNAEVLSGRAGPKIFEMRMNEIKRLQDQAKEKAELILRIDKKLIEAQGVGIKPPAIIGRGDLANRSIEELRERLEFAEKKIKEKKLEIQRKEEEKKKRKELADRLRKLKREYKKATGKEPDIKITRRISLKEYEKVVSGFEKKVEEEKKLAEVRRKKNEKIEEIEKFNKKIEQLGGEPLKMKVSLEDLSINSLKRIEEKVKKRLEEAKKMKEKEKEKQKELKEFSKLFSEMSGLGGRFNVGKLFNERDPIEKQIEEIRRKKAELEKALEEFRKKHEEGMGGVTEAGRIPRMRVVVEEVGMKNVRKVSKKEAEVKAEKLKGELYVPGEFVSEKGKVEENDVKRMIREEQVEEFNEEKEKTKQERIVEEFKRKYSDLIGELLFSNKEILKELDAIEKKAAETEISEKKIQKELSKWLRKAKREKRRNS